MLYKDIPDNFARSVKEHWEAALARVDTTGRSPSTAASYCIINRKKKQSTLEAVGYSPAKPVTEQRDMLVRALCLGSLPLTFLHNKGKNDISGYVLETNMMCLISCCN